MRNRDFEQKVAEMLDAETLLRDKKHELSQMIIHDDELADIYLSIDWAKIRRDFNNNRLYT